MLTNEEVEIIVGCYENTDTALEMFHISDRLEGQVDNLERVIRDAINDGLLYVDDIVYIRKPGDFQVIGNRGGSGVFLALSKWGEDVWGILNE